MKRVLFLDRTLCERGTSVATFDYADCNETVLGNESVVVGFSGSKRISEGKYRGRFDLHLVDDMAGVAKVATETGCEFAYTQKSGEWDGILVEGLKNLIHVVFPHRQQHGDVYAYISGWLAREMGQDDPHVPYMVRLPDHDGNLRDSLGLGGEFVFGWYGGNNFNIPFAREAVVRAACGRGDVAFLFMNQEPFCDLPNVRFLPPTVDQAEKVAFINTCDAMVHARNQGETFGLAIAEFSIRNKPVVTYSFKRPIDVKPELAHIDMLGDTGIYYDDGDDLEGILTSLTHAEVAGKDWNRYRSFTPEAVMVQFNQVFLGAP